MKRYSILFLSLAMLALVGCGSRSFGSLTSQTERVETTTITRTIQFVESGSVGPEYSVSLTVPSDWVGRFQTTNRGNRVVFEFINERGRTSPIFSLDALSNAQYWEQVGSLPGDYNSIINTADTYIVYHLPLTAFYSGLPPEQYQALSDAIPGIIQSVNVTRLG
jgi:hypothetical protein